MAFHARLKELREAAGLTQGELAERADMSKGGIANLEQDRTEPAWGTVQKLAKALGVDCTAFTEPAESEKTRSRGRPRKSERATAPDTVKEVEPAPKPKKGKGASGT
jgi:transcriptional regulator with XRE-family HTH domain